MQQTASFAILRAKEAVFVRLFLGIELPPAWRRVLAQGTDALQRAGVRGKFTLPDNYHLTLVFLGETQRQRAAEAALRQAGGSPFPLRSASPGCFPRKGGDIWWLGVNPAPGLLAVQRRLEKALRASGFSPEERPYRPHITLARKVRSPAGLEPLTAPNLFPPLEFQVNRITLFSSQRVDGALRYLPLYRVRL